VYGDIIEGAHTEEDLLKPSNPYSATKAAADMLILAWHRTYNIPYIIVRPTNNYGIGQYVEKLIPKACKYIELDKKLPLHNNGSPIRNWLHAKDTARAIITIIEKGCKNEIFNINGNLEQTNLQTFEKIMKIYEKRVEDYIDCSYNRDGQDLRYALNDDKLKGLGWEPIFKFDEEILNIVNYYKSKFIW
jgi:dTDP-glucose 4,6-dehydratase